MRTFKRERYYALRIIHEVIQGREKRHSAIVSLVLKIGGALELTFFLGLGTIKGKLSRRQKLKIKETIQKSSAFFETRSIIAYYTILEAQADYHLDP